MQYTKHYDLSAGTTKAQEPVRYSTDLIGGTSRCFHASSHNPQAAKAVASHAGSHAASQHPWSIIAPSNTTGPDLGLSSQCVNHVNPIFVWYGFLAMR